jgi:predicted dehydrogenase
VIDYTKLLPTPLERDPAFYREETVKVAVVGFGKMGILHATIVNLLREDAVKHVVDTNRLIRLGGALLLKKVEFWSKLKDLFNREEVDAVYVTTPTPSHYPVAKEILEAGAKGIFIEKPPTVDAHQASELADLAKHTVDMVGLTRRYSLTFRHAKELLTNLLAEHPVTEVRAYVKYGSAASPAGKLGKVGRGVLLDMGVYLIDLLHWYFGDLHAIKASYKSIHSKADDIFRAELATDKSFPVHIEADWTDPSYRLPEAKIEVAGDGFTLEVSDDSLTLKREGETLELHKPHYYAGFPPVNLAYPEYVIEDMHFLTCLRRDCKPETSLAETVKVMQTIDELYEIARPW